MKNLSEDLFIIDKYTKPYRNAYLTYTKHCISATTKKKYLHKGKKKSMTFECCSSEENPVSVSEFLIDIKGQYYELLQSVEDIK